VAIRDPDAPDLAPLVGELTMKSQDFANLWQRYDVRRRRSEVKHLRHPLVGELTLSYETLAVSGADGQRLCIYQATPGTPDHDALTLLALSQDQAERG
jgi:hypothetical protein